MNQIRQARLRQITAEIVECRRCSRLREYTAEVARVKRKAFLEWEYWGKPVPGFGDPAARLLLVGLAPAAHGGNRTGRAFTGDPSGDFLYAALARYGFASQAESTSIDDGLTLRDCYISIAARCAPPENKPTRQELDNCRPYLAAEMAALDRVQVVIALGAIAWQAVLKTWAEAGVTMPRPRPKFRHGEEWRPGDGAPLLIGSYHPSQRNTQTGLLTRAMFDGVFSRAKRLLT